MTTTVTVKALHGWPVDVTGIDPETGAELKMYRHRVAAGESRDFHVHGGMDLRIHEIQPEEAANASA